MTLLANNAFNQVMILDVQIATYVGSKWIIFLLNCGSDFWNGGIIQYRPVELVFGRLYALVQAGCVDDFFICNRILVDIFNNRGWISDYDEGFNWDTGNSKLL